MLMVCGVEVVWARLEGLNRNSPLFKPGQQQACQGCLAARALQTGEHDS